MPTDTERREVARRLRRVADKYDGVACTIVEGHLGIEFDERFVGGSVYTSESVKRLADLIEPNRGSGGRTILCAHCESASWCGCEPGDEEGGCDFIQNITEGEPPYNLYSLYEAVLRRHPRDKYAIEDDEVEELVDALLDICNSPVHEYIQRPQSGEPEVKCVAEVKIGGERLEQLVRDAVAEVTGIDRDALMELADELSGDTLAVPAVYGTYQGGYVAACQDVAHRIREALGVDDG